MKNDDMKNMGKSLEVFDKFLKAYATKKLYLRLFIDFLKISYANFKKLDILCNHESPIVQNMGKSLNS
jgi:hypothetical protein